MKEIIKRVALEIRNLPDNIANVFGWTKVLWNNWDWDELFLIDVIEYKLKKTKRYLERDTVLCEDTTNTAKEYIDQINICLGACKQILNNEYETNLIYEFYNKYPETLEEFFKHVNDPWEDQKKKDFDDMHALIDKKNLELRHQLFDMLRDKYDLWGD